MGETETQNSVSCTEWGQSSDRSVSFKLAVLSGGGLGSCQRTRSPSYPERVGSNSSSTEQEERLAGQRERQGQRHGLRKEKPFHGGEGTRYRQMEVGTGRG